jgi:hypothetical protein
MGNICLIGRKRIYPYNDKSATIQNHIKEVKIVNLSEQNIVESRFGNKFDYNDAWERYQHR